MEEKYVPWWRKALSFALGGIRSGFGLFSKSQKDKAEENPEIVAGHKISPEEDEGLNENTLPVEPVAEVAHRVEALAVSEIPVAPAPEIEAPIETSPAPEPVSPSPTPRNEPEAEPVPEAAVAGESAAETLPEEPAEQNAAAIEVPETALEMHADPAETPRVAGVPQPAHETSAEIALQSSDQVAGEASQQNAPAADAVVENGDAPEVSPLQETVPEAVEEPPEPAEQAEPQAKYVVEPAVTKQTTFAAGPDPELDDSSVELNEPAIEEPPEQVAGHPEADVAEIQPEAVEPLTTGEKAPEFEAAPEEVVAEDPAPEASEAEQVEEEIPEPVYESMALNEPVNEPIGEQAAEPIAVGEAVPVPEAAANALSEVVTNDVSAKAGADTVPDPVAGEVSLAVEVAPPTEEEPVAEPELKPPPPAKAFIKLATRDNEADLSPFSVVVSEVYDGPLDLLLDLIRKQDIDIYDIPIARITAQFLAYVNQLKAADVDVAGEFIYTASLLIHIKSKMLLPRAPAGPDDAEDPRRELVERLLEHERFKNAAQMLQQKQMLEAATWTNPGLREFKDDESAEPEIAADTVDLVRVFRDILERARNRPVINVEEDSVTVGQMIQFLARRLTMEDKPVALRRLLSHTKSERSLIAMFLALLELVRLQAILLRQDRAFSEIFIKKHTGFESVMNEGLDRARDDWR